MLRRLERLRALRDRGTGTLEWVAALALAAVVATASIVTLTGSHLDGVAEHAICLVKSALDGGGCTDGPTGPPPADHPPFDPKPVKCKITEHGEKVNSEVKIAFVTFGENAGFVETTYSDGTVTYTATDGASLGVTGGFGTKLDLGKVERGAKVDFGAGVEFGYGSTWVFKDAHEAEAMKKQLNDYLVEQETLKHDTSGGYAIWLAIKGATEPPKPPGQTVSTFELKGDAGASVGLSLPWEPGKSADESGVPNLTLAQAGLKFGGSGKWTQIRDTTTGSSTYTTGGEVWGEASAQGGPLAGVLKGLYGSSMAITRDKDDQITKVTLVTTREGKATGTVNGGQKDLGGNVSTSGSGSDITITTTSLDVTTPEQRALVNAWLAAQSDPDGAVSPQTYFPDRLVPGDPFQNLMYTNATVSNVQYDNVSDKQGFAAEVKLGVALGIDLSLETTDSKAVDATYLGTPGGTGVRPPVDFPECEAK